MYKGVAGAALKIRADQAVLDGQIVSLDESGRHIAGLTHSESSRTLPRSRWRESGDTDLSY